jgi:hypothetical protein
MMRGKQSSRHHDQMKKSKGVKMCSKHVKEFIPDKLNTYCTQATERSIRDQLSTSASCNLQFAQGDGPPYARASYLGDSKTLADD